MACQTQSFWVNFDTLRKSRRRNSIWGSFLSPYDVALTSEEGLLQSRLSRDTRTSRSLPPRSPRTRRRGAASPAPLTPFSTLRDRHHAAAAAPPRADINGRCASCAAEKKKKKRTLKKKKNGVSKSAEFLEDSSPSHCELGFWEQKRLLSRISRSSDELSRVKRVYLEELDLCNVGLYASRSDESLNCFGLEGADVCPDAAEWEGRALAHLHGSLAAPRRAEQRRQAMDFSERRGERASRSTAQQSQRLSRRSTRAAAGGPAGDDADDHPAVTVRPGYRLPRSRSCGAKTYQRVASPPREGSRSPRWMSSASLKPERSGVSRALSADPGEQEALALVGDIPPVSQLRFNKYNFRRRRPDRLELHKDVLFPQGAGRHHPPEGLNLGSSDTKPRGGDPGRCECGCARATAQQQERASARKTSRSLLLKTFSFRSKSVDRAKASTRSPAPRDWREADAGRCPLCWPRGAAVLGEDADGRSRGLIFDGSSSARTGSFPNSLVARHDAQVGGMSGRGKATAAVKKVSPPRVPDAAVSHRHSGSSLSSGVYSAGSSDQRSSYSSSVGEDNPPPSPRSPAKGGAPCDHGQLGRHGGANQHGNNSPSHFHNQQFTFPTNHQQQVPQFAHLMCPKTSPGSPHHVPPDTTYSYLTYHHQTSLEDQGIDVQSPGRSSPGSGSGSSTTGSTASSGGCRNSTTSLDSGRASTTTHTHQHRLSGQSYDSGSILRHSYHSSSSSLGSMEHDGAIHVNVTELLNNGVRDSEVLRAWLTDLRFEEYYEKFISAGYDMPTIFKMTPEDLNAIGITKPAHRKKLKAEITRLNIPDRLPDFIPGRLEEWLAILRLEEYTGSLKQQGYTCVEQMTQLTWEDLEDIGITKLGHQKKVMLAIKRIKDIMAGKKFSSNPDSQQQSHYGTHEIMISRENCEGRDQYASVPEFRTFSGPGLYNNGEHSRLSGPADPGGHYGVPAHYGPGVQYGPMPPPQAHVHPLQKQPVAYHLSGQFSGPQGPSPPGPKVSNGQPHPLPGPGQVQYRPDVVAVQVRPGGRGRSVESLEEPIYGTYQTFHPDSRIPNVQGPMSLGNLPPRPFPPSALGPSHPQRSMDDGDITPTNEYTINYEGGGTLPRPRTANKLRPVAKVTAKTRVDIHEVPQFIKDGNNAKNTAQTEEANKKELNMKALNRQNSENIYSSTHCPGSNNNTPQGTPKKLPPPPPRRSNSISETSKETAAREAQYGYRRGMSYGYMGIKNNLQPDVTPDLPPPPAPPDSANHQHLPDDFPPPPPPLTCVTMASASRISASSTITTSSITSDTIATSQTSTTASEGEVGEFRPRRNDSNASFKSTSSTDSDSMPFANENAGTIKQRACRPHPGLSVLDTRNSPHSSPRSSPALRRKEAQPPLRQNPIAAVDPASTTAAKSNSNSPDGTGDVLNDIGNMLANLTDELDAMLEQELTLKN